MNKLCFLKNLGFKIPWKLITIGLYGNGEIPPLVTHIEVVDYLDGLLTDIDEQTDNIVALICEKDDREKFDKLIKELASEDNSNIVVQKRKWRVYMLKTIVDNINEDSLQGMLELMEFWVSIGKIDNCPQTFPNSDNKKSIQEYFTQASYEFNLNKNREWLNEEIQSIIKLDKTGDGSLSGDN